MQYKNLLLILIPMTVFLFPACDKDDPEPENPEELITTLTMSFTPDGGGTPVVMQWQDLDGDGGNPPQIVGGTLGANAEYDVLITVLNESVNPVADITEEIIDEGEDHQFFFAVTTELNLTGFSYLDQDVNGNPIGVETIFNTGDPSSGNLQVTLRHEPDKSAQGVSMGDITNAGGETDIDVQFPVTIQ